MPSLSLTQSLRKMRDLRALCERNYLKQWAPRLVSLDALARRIIREHKQCQSATAVGLLHARNAGELLLQAQALLAPEQWRYWLADCCSLSEKTAQTYINITAGWSGSEGSVCFDTDGVPDDCPADGVLPSGENPPDETTTNAKGEIQPPLVVVAELMNHSPNPHRKRQTTLSPFEKLVQESKAAKPSDRPPIAEQLQTNSPTTLTFWIPGSVTPKARPRVTLNGTYLPKRYREWRLRAEGEILMQLQQIHPTPALPIERAALRILLCGKHRGDGDNAIGSVCDALVGAGVLQTDSLKHLCYGSWKHVPHRETGVKIQLKLLEDKQA
ncbi:RusA family crossover junction endodeoxyribonuclease [Phormidium sp. CCY1219]|uniref:RusA family crossover junction endodeoxyribonuclease n=1 Tax=Phormidium sp. CCY1219 TaxID=2886104 RepID=UPI002D1E7AE7|nr:RusA family crossover junction endodeoxyribonuclease [Phormidium sp. CCY1219]MEB3829189.1 RusA family crossover junction endodeoxyribonuclease [Phormidium sp. CCY1219]